MTKVIVNDGGGTLTLADVSLWIDGAPATSEQAVFVTAGSHIVSETGAANYDAVISGDCDANGAVIVAAGGTSSCTITNTYNALAACLARVGLLIGGPESPDTDGDGIGDRTECENGSDPLNPDTDGDGIDDGDEIEKGTDPLNPDTDGDGVEDGVECQNGSDPLDPSDLGLPPPPDLIFTDGFESGDTSAWSSTLTFGPGFSTGTYHGSGGTNTAGLRTAQGAAVPIEVAVASIVGDYDGIFVYDPTINAVNPSDNFLVYRPEPALAFLNTLTELRSGQAYFIFNSGPDGIVWQQGLAIVEARSVALVSGFNFVGWSGPELAPLEDAIADIRDLVRSAFVWDPEAQEYLIYFRDAPAGLNTLDFFLPFSRAVWIFMDAAATWNQPARDGEPQPAAQAGG